MINNYQKILNMRYRCFSWVIIAVVLISILSIYICRKDMYDKLDLYAISDGVNLLVTVPIEYSDTINDKAILKIKNIDEEFTIINISELLVDNTKNINYQIFTISTKKVYPLNQVVKVRFFYNKEKIFKKVIRIIKE